MWVGVRECLKFEDWGRTSEDPDVNIYTCVILAEIISKFQISKDKFELFILLRYMIVFDSARKCTFNIKKER